MLAATARSDDAEHDRLIESAPWVTFRVPHTHGRAEALLVMAMHNRIEQLDFAGMYFRCSAYAAEMKGKRAAVPPDRSGLRLPLDLTSGGVGSVLRRGAARPDRLRGRPAGRGRARTRRGGGSVGGGDGRGRARVRPAGGQVVRVAQDGRV